MSFDVFVDELDSEFNMIASRNFCFAIKVTEARRGCQGVRNKSFGQGWVGPAAGLDLHSHFNNDANYFAVSVDRNEWISRV